MKSIQEDQRRATEHEELQVENTGMERRDEAAEAIGAVNMKHVLKRLHDNKLLRLQFRLFTYQTIHGLTRRLSTPPEPVWNNLEPSYTIREQKKT